MGTPLGPKYIPYTYIDPLGSQMSTRRAQCNKAEKRRQESLATSVGTTVHLCSHSASHFLANYTSTDVFFLHGSDVKVMAGIITIRQKVRCAMFWYSPTNPRIHPLHPLEYRRVIREPWTPRCLSKQSGQP